MSQYPVIFRLSTLGLRQHQEFDYDFHSFRTDFIGESGAGKSMVADLLQLILVGAEAFESATAAMGGKRTPDGMVLKISDGRGTEIGYAFLNLQISAMEYVVIGVYIQATGRTVPFVIQHGFDDNKLIPLVNPLSFLDFLQDNKIIPLDELVPYLESKGVACTPYSRRKNYHKFLFQHELLGLDLSDNEKVLKDYATIIQSFSRGNSPETQRGNGLKEFLFGNEDAKKIYADYQDAIHELQDGFVQYARNKEEIQLITNKQQRLAQLIKLEQVAESARFTSLLHDLQYTHQENERWKRDVNEIGNNTRRSYNSLLVLRDILEELKGKSDAEAKNSRVLYDTALREHNIQEIKWRVIQQIDGWLTKYQTTIDNLLGVFEAYMTLKKYALVWRNVNQILADKGIDQLLQSFMPVKSRADLIAVLDMEISDMKSAVKGKQAFQQFLDINDPGSLGRWALEQQRGFNLEEESIIMHFKDLTTRKPGNVSKNLVRYISSPGRLLEKKSITESNDDGGWLDLNGLREYIPWVRKQILADHHQQQIQQFFEQEVKNLNSEIKELENKINSYDVLRKIVFEVEFDNYIQALAMHSEISQLAEEDDLMKQSESLIKERIIAYTEKESVQQMYNDSRYDSIWLSLWCRLNTWCCR